MEKFKDTVPFDPGYSALSFSFMQQMSIIDQDYQKLKANHQKKFWLTKYEQTIIDCITKTTAFYLGCLLWGSFLHFRFKDSPKKITGNSTQKLTKEEQNELDCAIEAKTIQKYLQNFERDCKYFLNREPKVPATIKTILENYIEFATINDNFKNTSSTDDIKVTSVTKHFEKLSKKQLDELCKKIYSVINSGKIELLLDIEFFQHK